MIQKTQPTDDILDKDLEAINSKLYKYIKIIAVSFILPIWIVVFINGIAILWKILNWIKLDIKFWSIKAYSSFTLLLLIIPIIYLIWFYHLTIKRTLLQVYRDLLLDWNVEIGKLCANYLIELETNGKDSKNKFDIAVILTYINKKLDYLPKLLQWVIRNLIDQIPFAAFINSFNYKDLTLKNEAKISNSITEKINEFELDYIHSIVPKWFVLLIPINLLLLFFYWKL